MEHIDLILTALGAGATYFASGALNELGKDAYEKLKLLLEKKFSNEPLAKNALQKYQEKPAIWIEPLRDILKENNIYQDQEIVDTANAVTLALNEQQAQFIKSKYGITFNDQVNGAVVGENNNVTLHFNNK